MKKKIIYKFASCLLAILILFSFIPLNSIWAVTEETYQISDTITATLDSDGTFTISGTGDMPDYRYTYNVPWGGQPIKKVIVEEGITKIGKYNFTELTSLTEVSLPDTITQIGEAAFYGCTSLTSFVVPKDVKLIDYGAFGNCYALSDIELNEGLEEIGAYAFQNVIVTSVTLPSTLKDYGAHPFFSVDTIKEYKVAEGNEFFYTDEYGVLYEIKGDYTYLDAYPPASTLDSYTIPDGIISIGTNGFANAKNLKNIDIPESVYLISESAFANSGITSITITAPKLEVFGPDMFENCTELETVNIYSEINDYFSGSELKYNTFANCINLKEVNLSKGVETFGNSSFYNCTSLETITIPEGSLKIESEAFLNCTSLQEVIWPNSIKHVADDAFDGCDKLAQKYPDGFELKEDGWYRRESIDIKITGKYYYDMAQEVLEIVNNERSAVGVEPIVMTEELWETANQRAAETAILFSHDRPDDSECFAIFPDGLSRTGENIARFNPTAESVMQSWMSSAGHRGNILNPSYKTIGISCFYHDGAYFWVQCFGNNGTEKTVYPEDETKQVTIPVAKGYIQYSLSNESVELQEGEELNITVDGDYTADPYWGAKVICDNENFVWDSEDESIVTVDNGKVIAKEKGNTTINVTTPEGNVISIPVTVNSLLKGDVNYDGVVGLYDAFQILRTVILGDGDLSEDEQYIMDYNDDGEVGLYDAFQFLRQVILS